MVINIIIIQYSVLQIKKIFKNISYRFSAKNSFMLSMLNFLPQQGVLRKFHELNLYFFDILHKRLENFVDSGAALILFWTNTLD